MSDKSRQESPPPGLNAGGGARLGMAAPAEKAKDFHGTLRRLLFYIRPYRVQLLFVAFAAVLGTIFSIFSPKILGQATTIIFQGVIARVNGDSSAIIDFGSIGQIVQLLLGLYLASAAFIYLEQFIMAGVAQKVVYDMRTDVSRKLRRLPLKYFDTHTHGEILSRVTNDMDTVGSTLQQSMTQFITSIVTLSGILIMMLSISTWMTLISLITLPLTFLITKKIAKISQKNFAAQQRELGKLNGHVEEMYGSHVIVKAFGNEKKSIQEFKDINGRLYEAGQQAQFVSGLIMPLIGFLNNIGYVLI
ncbi:MAG: ABC transporter ATP-binding protein, partial [Firmicutes bacterium]|nr:ABC transporter ATP-binding protein [Bacillota bacterium]